MGWNTHKGFFKPNNPSKYRGDPTRIIYRSSWELTFMVYLDKHPDVLEWSSEEIIIPYISPMDGRVHRYFPDFYVRKRNASGVVEVNLIEVKPASQCKPPKAQKKATKRYVQEVYTWGVNSAKWAAAEKYCEERNWKFKVMTARDLGIINV